MHRIAKTLPPIAQCLRWWRYARDLLPLWLASPEQTPYGFRLRTPRYRNMVMDVYERDEISSFGQTIASRGIDMLLDVGANVGVYSCYALSKGVRTLAFEPVARNLRYLYRNVIDNGWAERCEVWPMAVSGRPGLRVFYDGARGASASLIAGWAGSDKRFAAVAPCTTLDLAVGTRFQAARLFIKIDVEGAELEVLRGAGELLKQTIAPIWQIEICLTEWSPSNRNPDFRAVFELMASHGYEARTAGREARPVGMPDVDRWIERGEIPFAQREFIFQKGSGK